MATQNNNPQGIWGKVLNIDEEIRKNAKLAMGLVFIVMLGINWMDFDGGFRAINITITIIGFWKWYETAFKPTHLKYATLAGLAWAVLKQKNPGDGVKEVMVEFGKLVNNVGYIWLLVGFTLSTWSFANNPVAFPIIAVGIIIVTLTGMATGWRAWIISAYAILAITVAIWSTFGDSWNGRSFNPNTGAALHMVDPTTGKLDSLSRTPAECSVRACFSEESGAELVSMNPDQALSRNVTAWPGLGAETVRSSTGLSIWLIVLLVAVFAGAIWLWSGKGKVVGKPVVLAAMLVAAGWAGYTYAWPAVAGTSFGCPGTFSTEDKIVVRRGCKTEISGTIAAGSNLMAMDGRFDGLLTQYVDIEQPFAGFVTLKPNKGFPAGVDQVEVRILTAAEAVRRTEFIAEEGAGDNADKLFGKFKP